MSRDAKDVDRRTFLGTTAAAAAAMFIKPALVHGTKANSAIRVGLLGCGGRGTEDAGNLVGHRRRSGRCAGRLVQDQLDAAHAHFDQMPAGQGVRGARCAAALCRPRAYEQIAASPEVDAIVIATPPYFHPQHLETSLPRASTCTWKNRWR